MLDPTSVISLLHILQDICIYTYISHIYTYFCAYDMRNFYLRWVTVTITTFFVCVAMYHRAILPLPDQFFDSCLNFNCIYTCVNTECLYSNQSSFSGFKLAILLISISPSNPGRWPTLLAGKGKLILLCCLQGFPPPGQLNKLSS